MAGLLATKPRVINVAALAEEALWQELELTPKPGLVDKNNNGSHRDMDHALFVRSIRPSRRGLRALTTRGVSLPCVPIASSSPCCAPSASPANRPCCAQPTG